MSITYQSDQCQGEIVGQFSHDLVTGCAAQEGHGPIGVILLHFLLVSSF